MSDTAFVQQTLGEIYTTKRFGSVKGAQYEAYSTLRKHIRERPLTLRRVRAFFEGKAKVIRGEEKDAVRAAKNEETRREYQELKARLSRLEASMSVADEAFFGPQMDAYRTLANGMGGLDLSRRDD
jgi:hypothetical protein